MLCRHCGGKISLLRRLNDAEFCSDRHRSAFLELEREAVLARLTESGSRIIPLEPAPPRKGGKKQVRDKGEIPAPLADILREPERKPKAKRTVFCHVRMLGWTLVQELPQATFAIQARHMDVAGGVPMETHPARPAQLVQISPAEPAPPAAGQSEPGPPPFATLAGLSSAAPMRGTMAWRVDLAAWCRAEPRASSMPRLAMPRQAAGTGWPALLPMVALAMPRPGRAAWGGNAGLIVEGRNQAVEAHLTLPPDAANRIEPGLGARPAESPWDALVGIDLAGLMEIGLRTRPMPRHARAAQVRAVGPKRRLVGPRVRRTINPAPGFVPAPQAFLPAGRPMRLAPAQAVPGTGTLKGELAGPVLPVRIQEPEIVAKPGVFPVAGLRDPDPLRARIWMTLPACPAVEAAWPGAESLRPLLGLTVEGELAIAAAMAPAVVVEQVEPEPEYAVPVTSLATVVTPVAAVEVRQVEPEPEYAVPAAVAASVSEPVSEAVAESPAAAATDNAPDGPPLIDRQFPLFASRGLKSLHQPLFEPAGMTALWVEQLARQPQIRPMRLIPDHADGSGSRVTEILPAEPSKPWLSIHLPSLPIASWRAAPADLKWITLALPAILLLALYSFLPARSKNSVETASTGSGQHTALSQRFETVRTAIMQRAAVKMADDFRAGLGAWQGTSGWAQTWTYTDASFVSPGQLALYKPSLEMRDYVFAFLGQIDRRSLNWVVRARDENNYVAMRIVMTRSGPMPSAALIRYAVLDGKMDRQTTLPLPVAFRDGTMQQVEVTVAGDTITTRIMGQVVDSFSEDRLQGGGVGFYSPKGDRSLLRWISITHQYDYIGRLCALLAPYHVSQEARRME